MDSMYLLAGNIFRVAFHTFSGVAQYRPSYLALENILFVLFQFYRDVSPMKPQPEQNSGGGKVVCEISPRATCGTRGRAPPTGTAATGVAGLSPTPWSSWTVAGCLPWSGWTGTGPAPWLDWTVTGATPGPATSTSSGSMWSSWTEFSSSGTSREASASSNCRFSSSVASSAVSVQFGLGSSWELSILVEFRGSVRLCVPKHEALPSGVSVSQ